MKSRAIRKSPGWTVGKSYCIINEKPLTIMPQMIYISGCIATMKQRLRRTLQRSVILCTLMQLNLPEMNGFYRLYFSNNERWNKQYQKR